MWPRKHVAVSRGVARVGAEGRRGLREPVDGSRADRGRGRGKNAVMGGEGARD